jgi:hypothetical protein
MVTRRHRFAHRRCYCRAYCDGWPTKAHLDFICDRVGPTSILRAPISLASQTTPADLATWGRGDQHRCARRRCSLRGHGGLWLVVPSGDALAARCTRRSGVSRSTDQTLAPPQR